MSVRKQLNGYIAILAVIYKTGEDQILRTNNGFSNATIVVPLAWQQKKTMIGQNIFQYLLLNERVHNHR